MKYKVYNHNKFSYGIRLMDGIREIVVPPHNGRQAGFIILDEDEIYWLNSSSRTFRDGFLTTDEVPMTNMGYIAENQIVMSDEEILKLLKGNPMKLKAELKKITVKHLLDRIIAVAKTLDLPISKIKDIEEVTKINFIDEVE